MFSWAATFDEYFIQASERSWEQKVQLLTSVIMKNALVWCSLSLYRQLGFGFDTAVTVAEVRFTLRCPTTINKIVLVVLKYTCVHIVIPFHLISSSKQIITVHTVPGKAVMEEQAEEKQKS